MPLNSETYFQPAPLERSKAPFQRPEAVCGEKGVREMANMSRKIVGGVEEGNLESKEAIRAGSKIGRTRP